MNIPILQTDRLTLVPICFPLWAKAAYYNDKFSIACQDLGQKTFLWTSKDCLCSAKWKTMCGVFSSWANVCITECKCCLLDTASLETAFIFNVGIWLCFPSETTHENLPCAHYGRPNFSVEKAGFVSADTAKLNHENVHPYLWCYFGKKCAFHVCDYSSSVYELVVFLSWTQIHNQFNVTGRRLSHWPSVHALPWLPTWQIFYVCGAFLACILFCVGVGKFYQLFGMRIDFVTTAFCCLVHFMKEMYMFSSASCDGEVLVSVKVIPVLGTQWKMFNCM